MIIEDKMRIRWKKSGYTACRDSIAMNDVSSGKITLEAGCMMIRDVNEEHPTPEQLLENMKWIGYPTENVKRL